MIFVPIKINREEFLKLLAHLSVKATYPYYLKYGGDEVADTESFNNMPSSIMYAGVKFVVAD